MSDLVGNPVDRFSQNEAHMKNYKNLGKTFNTAVDIGTCSLLDAIQLSINPNTLLGIFLRAWVAAFYGFSHTAVSRHERGSVWVPHGHWQKILSKAVPHQPCSSHTHVFDNKFLGFVPQTF